MIFKCYKKNPNKKKSNIELINAYLALYIGQKMGPATFPEGFRTSTTTNSNIYKL
jgi:hypothetical protein